MPFSMDSLNQFLLGDDVAEHDAPFHSVGVLLSGHCLSTSLLTKAFVADDVTVREQFCQCKVCKYRSSWDVFTLGLPVGLHQAGYSNTGTTKGSCDNGLSNSHLYNTHSSLTLFRCQSWHS